MLIRHIVSLQWVLLGSAVLLSGCATTRQVTIDYPSSASTQLEPLPGYAAVDGDDYYVQLVSDFDFKGDNILKAGCSDIGPSYENGALSATLMFRIRNDVLKLDREASGFLYQASTGKCNFTFDAKKVYLTPWMRLDSSKDTLVNYSFLTSENSDVNVSKLAGDVNAASNLLALTGVGTGVAVMGKLASNWVLNSPPAPTVQSVLNQQTAVAQSVINRQINGNPSGVAPKDATTPAVAAPPASPVSTAGSPQTADAQGVAKHSSEIHTLPALATLGGRSAGLNRTQFEVFEVSKGGFDPFGPDVKPLGTLKVYPEVLPSLLLKIGATGLPDATDLSLEELWRSQIKAGAADISLKQLIESAQHAEQPNLQPDWQNYREVEGNCRRLKVVLKELGFNKFDRNAVLYYFLGKSADWKNYNDAGQYGATDAYRISHLEAMRSKDFAACLSPEDRKTMKSMGLPVKTQEDWNAISESGQKTIRVLGPMQSIERQLINVIRNPSQEQMERQAFPLLATPTGGNGTVLLQNNLSNFGLEAMLGVPAIPGEGVVINASQLSKVLMAIDMADLSCARPAMEQGKPIANIGILLFTTKPGSPIATGGALEFEFAAGRIARLSLQHPTFRDFRQNLLDYPEIGGCRIEPALVDRLH